MFVLGFVQWIPHTQLVIRTLSGTLVSFGYLVLLFNVRPYKRNDVTMTAFAVQSATVLIFLMALCIQLFTSLDAEDSELATRIMGFDSVDSLIAIMIVTVLTSFATFILFTVYHAVFGNRMQVLRLSHSHEVPELGLKPEIEYHLFLSHIWSSGQDQAAVIKRRTQLLLPGTNVFLDVDDLEEIGYLEKYVAASQCVLLFLSKGYFFSPNCLKEVDAALEGDKPLALVHESDIKKGGAPVEALRADCESKKGRIAVFEKGGEVIPWHRVSDFQLLTLKMIATRVLHCMPSYLSHQHPPVVYIPGEIESQTFEFSQPVHLYASDFNPGAAEMVDEFVQRYQAMTVTQEPPQCLQRSNRSSQRLSRLSVSLAKTLGLDHPEELTHMVLYLTDQTFVGQIGQHLSQEVQQARSLGIEILLIHENDPDHDGCAFDKLFQSTPEELVSEGLYNKIAVACHPGPHRLVSLALIAKEVGGVKKRSKVAAAIQATRSAVSSKQSTIRLRRNVPGSRKAKFGIGAY